MTPHDKAALQKDRAMTVGNAVNATATLATSPHVEDPLAFFLDSLPHVVEHVITQQIVWAIEDEFPGTTVEQYDDQPAGNVVPFTGAAAQLAQAVNEAPHPAEQETTYTHSGPTGTYAQSQPIVQAQQSAAAAPAPVPGAVDPAIPADWADFFQDPTRYWDNRHGKKNPNSPDFKHKDTGKGLWIAGKYPLKPAVAHQLRTLGYIQ